MPLRPLGSNESSCIFWRSLGGPELTPEFRFHPERRWRADFAHIETRTLIEIEGGIFLAGGGRHNRASGFAADTEKYLEAALAGWRVLRLTDRQITAPIVERIIAFVRAADGCKAGVKQRPYFTAFGARICRTDFQGLMPGVSRFHKGLEAALDARISPRWRREKV